MKLVAKIPSHIVFKLPKGKEKYEKTNTNWYDLPESHPEQAEVQKYQVDVVNVEPFLVYTKKELQRYRDKQEEYAVYENKATQVRLVGYTAIGSRYQTRFEPRVLLPGGYCVSIPQDVLTNVLLKNGIDKDGTLPGEYVFSSLNRRIKLIQTNSGLHRAIQNHVVKRKQKAMSLKEMTVGKIYRTAAGTTGLFLGFVSTETMLIDLPENARRWWSKNDGSMLSVPVQDFQIRYRSQELASLWFPTRIKDWRGNEIPPEKIHYNVLEFINSRNFLNFDVRKSHSFVEEVDGYHLDLPTDIVNCVRSACERKASESLERSRIQRTNPDVSIHGADLKKLPHPPDVLRHFDACYIAHYSSLANMSLFGTGNIRSDTFKLFDRWEVKKKKVRK